MLDMTKDPFADTEFGKVALAKLEPCKPNFRLYCAGWLETGGPLNRPGFRGGCLVKVKRPHRRMCRVGCSSLPQPQPAGYSRWMSAGVDG